MAIWMDSYPLHSFMWGANSTTLTGFFWIDLDLGLLWWWVGLSCFRPSVGILHGWIHTIQRYTLNYKIDYGRILNIYGIAIKKRRFSNFEVRKIPYGKDFILQRKTRAFSNSDWLRSSPLAPLALFRSSLLSYDLCSSLCGIVHQHYLFNQSSSES